MSLSLILGSVGVLLGVINTGILVYKFFNTKPKIKFEILRTKLIADKTHKGDVIGRKILFDLAIINYGNKADSLLELYIIFEEGLLNKWRFEIFNEHLPSGKKLFNPFIEKPKLFPCNIHPNEVWVGKICLPLSTKSNNETVKYIQENHRVRLQLHTVTQKIETSIPLSYFRLWNVTKS